MCLGICYKFWSSWAVFSATCFGFLSLLYEVCRQSPTPFIIKKNNFCGTYIYVTPSGITSLSVPPFVSNTHSVIKKRKRENSSNADQSLIYSILPSVLADQDAVTKRSRRSGWWWWWWHHAVTRPQRVVRLRHPRRDQGPEAKQQETGCWLVFFSWEVSVLAGGRKHSFLGVRDETLGHGRMGWRRLQSARQEYSWIRNGERVLDGPVVLQVDFGPLDWPWPGAICEEDALSVVGLCAWRS